MSSYTFAKIENLQYCPRSNKIFRVCYEIPDKLIPIQISEENKSRRRRSNADAGKTTGLSKVQYLSVLLLRNEINACEGKPTSQDIIFRKLCKEFPNWNYKASDNFFKDISKYRRKYNTGKLYAGQPHPVLFSFHYNKEGFLCHKLRRQELLSFRYLKDHLRVCKFADPRFFSPNEIARFRKAQSEERASVAGWIIPLAADIRAVEKQIGKPLYQSLTFPSGYGPESKIL